VSVRLDVPYTEALSGRSKQTLAKRLFAVVHTSGHRLMEAPYNPHLYH
jgi:hypothetical protein